MNLSKKKGKDPSLPRHGGNLLEAIEKFGGSFNEWLDLSTGISPWTYPISAISDTHWQSLPPHSSTIINAAANYYQCKPSSLTLAPGTQIMIRLIPTLLSTKQTIAIPLIGYQEHAYSWQLQGHSVIRYQNLEELMQLVNHQEVDNVVVINPNNPNGDYFTKSYLREIASKLSGIVILDEAFADYDASQSLSADSNLSNILILRSIGKFFGLAGARVGFLITKHAIGEKISTLLEPWSVSTASLKLGEMALTDIAWQNNQRSRIKTQKYELDNLLTAATSSLKFPLQYKSIGLFSTIFGNNEIILELHKGLASHKIWTRIGEPYFSPPEKQASQNWLRVSLPGENFEHFSKSLLQVFDHMTPES